MSAHKASGFGRALEQARIAGGISLDDAAQATRISPRYLLALEQEELNELPAPIYARGFLRSYAGYLGLDPADLTSLYPVPYIEPALQPVMTPAPTAPPRSLTYLVLGGVCAVVFLLGLLLITSGGSDSGGAPLTGGVDTPLTATDAPTDPAAAQENVQPVIAASGNVGAYVGLPIVEVRPDITNTIGANFTVFPDCSDQPIDTVLRQDPAPGTPVDETTDIKLIVSSGPCT